MQRVRSVHVLVLILTAGLACASLRRAGPPEAPEPAISEPIVAETSRPPPPPCLRVTTIDVYKREHRLRARCERGAVIDMHVALGRVPTGHKLRSGDQRTPEGLYRVSGPARPSRFHLFIPIDYPSRGDAALGLSRGTIGRRDYERILRAHEEGRTPPQDTALGSGLGFHGEGKRWRGDSTDLDWTYGCIALRDEDIDFLAERIEPGTPVRITAEPLSDG